MKSWAGNFMNYLIKAIVKIRGEFESRINFRRLSATFRSDIKSLKELCDEACRHSRFGNDFINYKLSSTASEAFFNSIPSRHADWVKRRDRSRLTQNCWLLDESASHANRSESSSTTMPTHHSFHQIESNLSRSEEISHRKVNAKLWMREWN